jgi:hypothetical protein
MIYRNGQVYACGKAPMERVGLTDMELYRHTLSQYTHQWRHIYRDTSVMTETNMPRIKIARTILVGGGGVPGKVQLY